MGLIKKLLKIYLISFLVSMAILFCFWSYQEISNRNSYVYLSLSNVKTKTKTFEKDGKVVKLVGMIHLGKKEYYQAIKNDNSIDNSIALTEGITNNSNEVIPESLGYADLASVLGLNNQWPSDKLFINPVSADVDYSDLPSDSRKDLDVFDQIITNFIQFHKKEITSDELYRHLALSQNEINRTANKFSDKNISSNPLLLERNNFLWGKLLELEESSDTIIIPWGALHLQDIEDRLISRGYRLKEKKTYLAVDLKEVLTKIYPTLIRLAR